MPFCPVSKQRRQPRALESKPLAFPFLKDAKALNQCPSPYQSCVSMWITSHMTDDYCCDMCGHISLSRLSPKLLAQHPCSQTIFQPKNIPVFHHFSPLYTSSDLPSPSLTLQNPPNPLPTSVAPQEWQVLRQETLKDFLLAFFKVKILHFLLNLTFLSQFSLYACVVEFFP